MGYFQSNTQMTRQKPMSAQEALQKLQRDPRAALREAGVNVPENMMGNPEAITMHLIQTGQIGGPILQKIMPAIQQLMGKK